MKHAFQVIIVPADGSYLIHTFSDTKHIHNNIISDQNLSITFFLTF